MPKCTNKNIYVGSQQYRMSHWLRFINPFTSVQFEKDTYKRISTILKFLVCFSFALAILNCCNIGIGLFLLSTLLHTLILYQPKMRNSRWFVKCATILIALIHKKWMCRCNGSFVLYNAINAIMDLLLVYQWLLSASLSIIENILYSIIFRDKSDPGLYYLLFGSIVTTLIFSCFERLMKENWVLFDSFKKSYLTFTKVFDTLPQLIIIIDKKGTILYQNANSHKLLYTHMDSQLPKRIHKSNICDTLKDESKSLMVNAIEKTYKGDITNIKMCLKVANSNVSEFQMHDITLTPLQWKCTKAICVVAHNVHAQTDLIINLTSQFKKSECAIESVITALETIITTEKYAYKKYFNILVSAHRCRHICDLSYAYGMYSLGAMPACVSSFDLKQMTKYFIEIVINDAFEKNISVKMKIDNSFPEDVSGNLKALRCLFIEIFYFLIQKCSNTEVNVVAKLKQADTDNYIIEYDIITKLPQEQKEDISTLLNTKSTMETTCISFIATECGIKMQSEQENRQLRILLE